MFKIDGNTKNSDMTLSMLTSCHTNPELSQIFAEWDWMKIRTNLGIPRTVA